MTRGPEMMFGDATVEPILLRSASLADRPAARDAGQDCRTFHSSLPGYAPTPVRRAPRSAARLGIAEVIAKDESARLGLPSFKSLGAFWGARCALAERLQLGVDDAADLVALRASVQAGPKLRLSAATDGNHGRAVARFAALLGLEAQIYVPANMVEARMEAIAGEGASVTVVDGGYDDAVRRSAEGADPDCLVISDTSWEGYEDVPARVIEGYATIFGELEGQLEQPPDLVMVPVGVGALAAAAVDHFWGRPGPRPRLVAVEPNSAACLLASVDAGRIVTLEGEQDSMMAGLNCATPSMIAWPLVSCGMDAYLAIDDARVPEAMRLLAEDGVVAGETGAAALAGLLRLMTEPDAAVARDALGLGGATRALVLCTEGATDPRAYARIVPEP